MHISLIPSIDTIFQDILHHGQQPLSPLTLSLGKSEIPINLQAFAAYGAQLKQCVARHQGPKDRVLSLLLPHLRLQSV